MPPIRDGTSAIRDVMFNLKMKKEETTDIRMYDPDSKSTGTYEVVKISECRYKLANNDPFNESLSYGTIIEVETEKIEKDGESKFVFKNVHRKSEFTSECIGLPIDLKESEMRVVGQMIIDEGGFWEVIFGGMGFINLPKNSNLNVSEELNKLIIAKQNQQK